MSGWRLLQGDCAEVLAAMQEASVDAVVCDPPYGIRFMGQAWDGAAIEHRAETIRSKRQRPDGRQDDKSRTSAAGEYDLRRPAMHAFQVWTEGWASEVLRVLKPGGHLIAFGGTRTYHRLVCGLEDAGFEIRDQLAWLFGSGFPKSLDVAKALNAAGMVLARQWFAAPHGTDLADARLDGLALGVGECGAAVVAHEGEGTALKPAHEPIVLARKPLAGTVATNVLEHGTGALNIDACRIAGDAVVTFDRQAGDRSREEWRTGTAVPGTRREEQTGRWPANVVLDQEAAAQLDAQSGTLKSGRLQTHHRRSGGSGIGTFEIRERTGEPCDWGGDEGGASRFFYVAKPDNAERHAGLGSRAGLFAPVDAPARNDHPTVKPIDLIRWLVRLVCPPGGTVLDPFTGSGTTAVAALLEHRSFVGIERETAYIAIARARVGHWAPGADRLDEEAA